MTEGRNDEVAAFIGDLLALHNEFAEENKRERARVLKIFGPDLERPIPQTDDSVSPFVLGKLKGREEVLIALAVFLFAHSGQTDIPQGDEWGREDG